MPRTSVPPPIRPSRTHVLTGGNGSPAPIDRLTRIEALLENLQTELAVQFQRIADLQVQLDRAIADRPIKITRGRVSEDEKAALVARLDRIERLTDALVRAQADSVEARQMADRIKREVDATRDAIDTLNTHPPARC